MVSPGTALLCWPRKRLAAPPVRARLPSLLVVPAAQCVLSGDVGAAVGSVDAGGLDWQMQAFAGA